MQFVNYLHPDPVFHGASNGKTVNTIVMTHFQRARDLFAQVGVTLQLAAGFPKTVEPPKDDKGESLGTVVETHAPGKYGVPSSKGMDLINLCGAKTADIAILYCNELKDNGVNAGYGYAYPTSGGAGSYSNWAFVSGAGNGNTDLAFGHEVGHLLTNAGHFGHDYPRSPPENQLENVGDLRILNNLMRSGKPDGKPGIGIGCRLEQIQEDMIFSPSSTTQKTPPKK